MKESTALLIRKKRLSAIKSKFPLFYKECECCKNCIRLESMFMVTRWWVNKRWRDFYYCKQCMPTKEDVLNEVDTDECSFGIWGVDSF